MQRRFPFPLPAASALALVVVVHLAAQLRSDRDWVFLTKTLLMPLVALCLFLATRTPRTRETRLAFVALAFSWFGDMAPWLATGSMAFMLLVGFFLVAQVLYALAFLAHREHSILHRQPLWILAYLALCALLVNASAPSAGPLLPLIIVYAAAIVTMAVLATGLGWAGTLGGLAFVISDGLIALRAFTDFLLPVHGFWVMLTYVFAQVLLVVGVLRRATLQPARRARNAERCEPETGRRNGNVGSTS